MLSQLSSFVFNQKPGNQQGDDHSLGRQWAVASQAVCLEDLFDPFTQDLDLPSRLLQFPVLGTS